MPAHNNVIANAHFKKDWQGIAGSCRVRTWFNQAGRKKSRRWVAHRKIADPARCFAPDGGGSEREATPGEGHATRRWSE
jgi:single-stranded DNA-binding protein